MTHGFHRDSPPYLFSTELPFEALGSLAGPGSRALSVAGSGDVALWLLRLGAERVVAVDVSPGSLALAEIKRAAARSLSFEDFLFFFLSGSSWAGRVFEQAGIDGAYEPKRWASLSKRLARPLSRRANRFLKGLVPGNENPFLRNTRPTDLAVLGGIPFLTDPAQFDALKAKARAFPLVSGPIEAYMERTGRLFDLIYLSNLPEYVCTLSLLSDEDDLIPERIARMHALAASRVAAGGVVASYHFHCPEKRWLCCSGPRETLKGLGLRLKTVEVKYSRPAPLRASFTHHLLLASA